MSTLYDYGNQQIGTGLNITNYVYNNDTVLNILGTGVTNYSSYLSENFIFLLSNFSGPYPPGSNFAEYYRSSTSWIYSGETLENTKVLLPGQFWYQYPSLPLMSEDIYNIVEQLNSSTIATDTKTQLEAQLLSIYQDSTSYQTSGNLYVLNIPTTATISPLTYDLPNYGTIEVFDITQLGWEKVLKSDTGSSSLQNLDLSTFGNSASTSNIYFYTSSNESNITSAITATGGSANTLYSGNLTLKSNNITLTGGTVNNNATNYVVNAATVFNGTATLANVIPLTSNSQQIATTAFVQSFMQKNVITSDGGTINGTLLVPDPTSDDSKQVANAEYVNNQIEKRYKETLIPLTYFAAKLPEISDAFAAAVSAGLNYFYIPDGSYTISQNVKISTENSIIFGNGSDSIITQSFDGDLFTVSADNVSFKNFTVRSSLTRTTGYVINSASNDDITIEGIFVDPTSDNNFNGFNISSANYVKIENCKIYQIGGTGITLSGINVGAITNNIIRDCSVYSPGTASGINISGTNSNLSVSGNFSGNSSTTEKYQSYGIVMPSGTNLLLTNNTFYNNINGISVTGKPINIGNIVN